MALSDLAVFNEYAYEAMTEILDQKIDELVTASDGAIVISNAAKQGDFNESAFFALVAGGLVRRRNPYADGTVAEKNLSMLTDREVKVGAGTPPVRIDPGMFRWIQLDPKTAGATIAKQLAPDMLSDILNTGLGITKVALSNDASNVRDITGATGNKEIDFAELARAAALFGDQACDIRVWAMHSAPLHGLYVGNLLNGERLFTYSSVNVIRDPFGRLMIQTDSPALVDDNAGTLEYSVLGLSNGAVNITRNNDFDAMEETKGGRENIVRLYQAEWSFNAGVKGYAWDKTNGGKAPNDASLLSAGNWDRIATSHKDLAGVVLKGLAKG